MFLNKKLVRLLGMVIQVEQQCPWRRANQTPAHLVHLS